MEDLGDHSDPGCTDVDEELGTAVISRFSMTGTTALSLMWLLLQWPVYTVLG